MQKYTVMIQGALHDAYLVSEVDAAMKGKAREVEKLSSDLSASATVLARQCDMARDAERELLAAKRQIAALRLEISDLVTEHESRCDAASKCIAALKAERDKLLAIQQEQIDIVMGIGPITCRNGKIHPMEEDDCLYCRTETAETENKELCGIIDLLKNTILDIKAENERLLELLDDPMIKAIIGINALKSDPEVKSCKQNIGDGYFVPEPEVKV